MNDKRNRAGVKRRLLVLAEAACASVTMADASTLTVEPTYEFPGDTIERSAFYFGPVEGRSDPASIGRSSLTTDRFGVRCRLDVYGFATEADAEEAAERVLNAYDDTLRAMSRLVDPTGVIADGTPTEYAVAWAQIGQVDGPTGRMPYGEPASAGIDLTIEVQTEIKP